MKRQISIRIDETVLKWLQAESKRKGLRGYQTLANDILVKTMLRSKKASATPSFHNPAN